MSLARQIERARLMDAERKTPKVTVAPQPGVEVSVGKRLIKAAKEVQSIASSPLELSTPEATVLEYLDCDMSPSAMGKAERLEIARAILRALNTLKVKEYRARKKTR